jgi:hypothetical protein
MDNEREWIPQPPASIRKSCMRVQWIVLTDLCHDSYLSRPLAGGDDLDAITSNA